MISLFPHQQEALQETKDFDNIAVYHDMGLGKTFTGSEMMKRFGCKVNLIVCQKSKVQDWVEHFTDNYQMQVFDLTNKKQLGEYHGLSQGQRFFIVGVINYELAWRRKELLDLYDFTLMLDESSLIQNQKAKQTKFILKMKPAHVILLSGTPVGGKYENLWTQVHLLGWKISEDLYNRQYVNWTTIDSGGFQHKIVDKEEPYKNIDRLKSKMREHGAIFKKTEECYELPEQVFTHIRLKAPKEYWNKSCTHWKKGRISQMNCSKKMKRKIHNFVIKALTAINVFSLIYWICWIDCIISWQPYVIMLVNFIWICLVLYANGWVTDTEPYYERLEKEGEYYDEM